MKSKVPGLVMDVSGEMRETGRASSASLHSHAPAGNRALVLVSLSPFFCRCLFACWVSIVPSLKQVQKETPDGNTYWRDGLQDKNIPEDLGHNIKCFYLRLSCMLWGHEALPLMAQPDRFAQSSINS